MRRILIVADRLLGGAELRERLALKKSTDPDIELFVLVPRHTGDETAAAGDGSALADLKYKVDGAVGDSDPLVAVKNVLKEQPFNEIIVATPPAGRSRWVRMDLAHRMERVTKLPVEHLAGEEPAVAEETRAASV